MQGWVCLRMGKVALDMCVDVAMHTQVGGGPSMEPPSPCLGGTFERASGGQEAPGLGGTN